MGLKDVAALAEVIVDAARLGLDPGAAAVLERYQRWRRFDTMAMGFATDGLNRLFSNRSDLLRVVRDLGLGAVERLLGNAASRVSMSSTKSSTGHLLGAAGAVETIFSILAIRDNIAPPTINLENPSVETAIDLVPQAARKREINVVLSNSFGFGGTNASVILQRVAN